MKRKATSDAMDYFAAATAQQQNNTYKPLPSALLSATAAASASSARSTAAPTSAIPSFLSELLPTSAVSAYPSKLHNKFLQLAAAEPNTAAPPPTTAAQSFKQNKQRQAVQNRRGAAGKARRAGRPLTAKQRSQLRLLALPPPTLPTQPSKQPSSPALRYASFLPLHALWLSYIRDLLSAPHSTVPLSAGERLLRADYHGAKVTVARSTSASFVHVSGIVIQESASGWRILGEDGKARLVRKEGTVLRVDISGAAAAADSGGGGGDSGGWEIELYGDQLAVRSAERAAKKWKGKSNIQMNG